MGEKENSIDIEIFSEIGSSMKSQFKEAGLYTLKDLVVLGALDLSKVTGLDTNTCAQICRKARIRLQGLGILNKNFMAASFSKQKIERISTGTRNLDDLLGGGIETEAVTEFYGASGTGKTQVCFTLAAIVPQDKRVGGLNGEAIYVDTENTFRSERIASIAAARGFNIDTTLSRIKVSGVYDSTEQESLLDQIESVIDDSNNVKLLIVDSAISHYRAEFVGRSMLPKRQQSLNKFMHTLSKISKIYGVAVVITNQVQSPTGDMIYGSGSQIPTGGHIMAHASTYRIYLTSSGSKRRIAKIVHGPYHPEEEAL